MSCYLLCQTCLFAFPSNRVSVPFFGGDPDDPVRILDPCPYCKVRTDAIPAVLVLQMNDKQAEFWHGTVRYAKFVEEKNRTFHSDAIEGGETSTPILVMKQSSVEVNAAMIIANSLERLANVIEENLKPLKAVIEMAAKGEEA